MIKLINSTEEHRSYKFVCAKQHGIKNMYTAKNGYKFKDI